MSWHLQPKSAVIIPATEMSELTAPTKPKFSLFDIIFITICFLNHIFS